MSRRDEVYEYIVEYMLKNQYSPSVREICKGVGLKSTSSVDAHLQRLKRLGLIEYQPGQPRTIRVTGHTVMKSETRKIWGIESMNSEDLKNKRDQIIQEMIEEKVLEQKSLDSGTEKIIFETAKMQIEIAQWNQQKKDHSTTYNNMLQRLKSLGEEYQVCFNQEKESLEKLKVEIAQLEQLKNADFMEIH